MARTHAEGAQAAVTLMLVAIIALAIVVIVRHSGPVADVVPTPDVSTEQVPPARAAVGQDKDKAGQSDLRMARIRERFEQAVFMLHAGRYDDAVTALHTVLLLSPRLVAAHVNMGYALLGLKRYKAAGDFFRQAIDLDPYQGNAYWGLAEALEAENDLSGALGAMRTYIHLAKPGDPYLRRARSALWEWESQLKHGPPSAEAKAWMERRRQEDSARNAPNRDSPDSGEAVRIPLQPPPAGTQAVADGVEGGEP